MFKVVSPKKCRASAELLQTYLNMYSEFETEIRINWGCSGFENPENKNVKGNSVQAVANSVDKKRAFELLDYRAVPVIKIPEEFNGKIIAHLDPYASGGKGVKVVTIGDFWNPHTLYTRFIEGREFRAFFAYGEVIAIAEKVPVEEIKNSDIKSSKNGYGYQVWYKGEPIKGLNKVIADRVNEAQKLLGLDYGAIDFIVENETLTTYILESNSAPCLFDTDIAERMALKIIENVYGGEE